MALIAVVRLHGDLILFEETFAADHDIAATFEDFHYLSDSDGYTRYVFYWWCPGSEFEGFDDGLESDPTVRSFCLLSDSTGGRFYRIDTCVFPAEQPLVFPLLRKHDITSLEAHRDADGLHLRIRCPSRDALRGFREQATGIADNVDVVRLYTEQQERLDWLTDKQREAVALAFERGYFETPSQVSLDELAAELGVTSQTMSRHVRVGVEKILADALESAPDRL